MENRSLSLWKILVCSLVAYIFIFSIPAHLNVKWQSINTDKQVVIFNSDAAVVDEFNHVFVNENLKEYLPYDYDLLEGLYEKFELDTGDSLEKARQSYDLHWRSYHTGIMVSYLAERLA